MLEVAGQFVTSDTSGLSAQPETTTKPIARKQEDDVSDLGVLNYALTLEHLENAFYRDGLEEFSDEELMNADALSTFNDTVRMQVPEYLETVGVPVLGWRHDRFPAFYTRDSGFPVAHRVESAAEVARVLAARSRPGSGVLLTVPIPGHAELAGLDDVLDGALADADRAGIVGAAVTPFVLGRIAEATEGRSIPANLALAEHNAVVAAEVAVAVAAS